MEKAYIIALLEKYWRAETSVEEEKALAAYFKSGIVDADLEPYCDLFAYFEEEAQVSPGAGFESRILQAITPVRHFSWSLVAAAAAVLVVVAGVFIFQPSPPRATVARITDTYENPEQALAAVRHALLVASVHLNEGQKQITNK
jgi:hypothetical protein